MRLIGRPQGEPADQLGVVAPSVVDGRTQFGAWWCRRGLRSKRAADAGSRALERQQHVIRLDLHGLAGDLRRHGRVAVAIAADPATKAKERRRGGRHGARPVAEQHVIEPAVKGRDDAKQRLVEHRHRRAHLVERVDGVGAQVGGPPEDVDLLEQPTARVGLLASAAPWVVDPIELLARPRDRGHDGTAASFGRVCGQHRVEQQPVDDAGHSFFAVQAADLGYRRSQRVTRAALPCVTRPQDADPVVFLSEVGQVEVDRERASNLLGPIQRPAAYQGHHVFGRASAGPRGDDRVPQLLDVREKIVTAVLAQNLAEQLAEQPDVAAQGLGHLEPGTLPGDRLRRHRPRLARRLRHRHGPSVLAAYCRPGRPSPETRALRRTSPYPDKQRRTA